MGSKHLGNIWDWRRVICESQTNAIKLSYFQLLNGTYKNTPDFPLSTKLSNTHTTSDKCLHTGQSKQTDENSLKTGTVLIGRNRRWPLHLNKSTKHKLRYKTKPQILQPKD